ncbi:MAG: DNA repair protein RecO [Candidatus Uhrbacteria bacterium]|nr:DNA repair protein RecO [Candidatus Uhrbacteria bacterium]
MTYKVQGIIIGKRDHRDADRHFVLYTYEQGKIPVMAKSVRKIESKLSGNLELLNHALFTIGKGRTLDRIATVDVLGNFQMIKKNLYALSSALYCFEIFDLFVKWEQRDESLFLLLVDFLETLKKTPRTSGQKILAHLFLLKLSYLLGLYEAQPDLDEIHRQLFTGSLADCLERPLSTNALEVGVNRFLTNHLDISPRSQAYFDLLSPKENVTV